MSGPRTSRIVIHGTPGIKPAISPSRVWIRPKASKNTTQLRTETPVESIGGQLRPGSCLRPYVWLCVRVHISTHPRIWRRVPARTPTSCSLIFFRENRPVQRHRLAAPSQLPRSVFQNRLLLSSIALHLQDQIQYEILE